MKNIITQVLFVLKKYFFRFLILSVVFFVGFCSVSYVQSFREASVILAFTYPNASNGLYPNGTYFNAYNILSDEVISAGIRNVGLEGILNSHIVADEISIQPRSNASLITTRFIINYKAGKDDQLGPVSAEGLLHSIIYAYIDHFFTTYSSDQIVLNLDFADKESLEYNDLVSYYNVALNQLQKYLRTQQDTDKDFISDDGTSFQDLINIIERYRTTSLKEIKSIITERGVTRNREAYTQRLHYRVWNLTNTYNNNRNMHQLYKTILQKYESKLTSVVFIPSLDSERKFYMSKTKVGIDIYSLTSKTYEEKSEDFQRQIDQTNQYINMITNEDNTQAAPVNTARVNALLAKLKKELDNTMKKVRLVEKEFSQYKNHHFVTMTPVEQSFIERTNAKKSILFTMILDAVLVTILVVRKKKGKGQK